MLRPEPFTERIRHKRQDRDVQPLCIPFYTGVEDPLTDLQSFHFVVGCNGLSDERQCLLFPYALTEAALNCYIVWNRKRGNPTPRLKGLMGTVQAKNRNTILRLGKETRRKDNGGTDAAITERPYRIIIAVRKFSPC
ncbi:unnamed protein product [Prunus armeniaca]